MKKRVFAISMAVLWGISFASAINPWSGAFMGLCMGMAFGLFDPADKTEQGERGR